MPQLIYTPKALEDLQVKTFNIDKGQEPTDTQLQEIYEAKKKPIVFDEDSPELSPAMYRAFKSSVIRRNRKKMLEL